MAAVAARMAKGRATRILPVLLLLIAIVSAQQCTAGFGSYVKNGVCVPDLLVNMSNLVLLISFMIIAIAYMISQFLESPRLTIWVTGEMYQLFGTAVILGMYLSIVGSLNFIGPAFYATNLAYPGDPTSRTGPGDWVTVNDHAQQYVGCIFEYTKASIGDIATLSAIIGAVGSLTLSMDMVVTSIYSPLIPGLGGFNQITSVVIGAMAMTAVQLQLQQAILALWPGMFNVLLPLGIVFRSFNLTRPAGAALIAIAIGFTVLLPLMYLVVEDVAFHFTNVSTCADAPPKIGSISYIFSTSFSAAFGGVQNEISDAFSIGGRLSRMIFRLAVEGMIMPMFAYLIVLNIVKRLAELLGGEIDLSTLVRIV